MQARTIAVADLTPVEIAAWRDLAARALEPNPFFEPECLVPAARHLPDGAQLRIVVASDGAAWHGVLPVTARSSWRGVPWAVWDARGLDTAVGLGTPLLSAEPGAAGAVLDGLRSAGGAGVLVLDWLAEGRVAAALRTAASSRGMPVRQYLAWERGLLQRADAPDAWRASIKSDRLRRLRRHGRRLGERLGGEVTIAERPADGAAVQEFLRLEASGWKGSADHGAAYARAPETEAWFRDVVAGFAAAGRLLVLGLQVGERVVALEFCLRAGEGLFAWRVGHDDELSLHGPGAQLQVQLLRHFHEATDAGFLDSCAEATNDFALGIYPDRRAMSTTLIGVGGAVDGAVVRVLPVARRTARRLRELRAQAGRRARPETAAA
jgi:CelD/BcsL family acetyltransferase involved in cellulose biosynthesis